MTEKTHAAPAGPPVQQGCPRSQSFLVSAQPHVTGRVQGLTLSTGPCAPAAARAKGVGFAQSCSDTAPLLGKNHRSTSLRAAGQGGAGACQPPPSHSLLTGSHGPSPAGSVPSGSPGAVPSGCISSGRRRAGGCGLRHPPRPSQTPPQNIRKKGFIKHSRLLRLAVRAGVYPPVLQPPGPAGAERRHSDNKAGPAGGLKPPRSIESWG